MGFFSNLKNAITGGAATVQVQTAGQGRRGESIAVQINALAKSSGNVNAVYLLVRATENAQVKDTDHANGKTTTETVHGRKISYETRIAIAGPQTIEEGKTYSWEAQLPLPAQSNPTFQGAMINHVWEIQAGLDMTGNDPDSGWQPIVVS